MLSAGVRHDLKNKTLQLYSNMYVIYRRNQRGRRRGKLRCISGMDRWGEVLGGGSVGEWRGGWRDANRYGIK